MIKQSIMASYHIDIEHAVLKSLRPLIYLTFFSTDQFILVLIRTSVMSAGICRMAQEYTLLFMPGAFVSMVLLISNFSIRVLYMYTNACCLLELRCAVSEKMMVVHSGRWASTDGDDTETCKTLIVVL